MSKNHINEYDKLNKLLKDKKVLYIPIYSCFDYKTKLLNFKADGNINRFLTTFFNVNSYKSLDIVSPIEGNDYFWFDDCVSKLDNTKIIYSKEIKESAKVQRNISFAKKILNSLKINEYDIVIAEGQYVVLNLLDYYRYVDVIYWCPVCATDKNTRDFLEFNRELDKYIFSRVDYTIFTSQGQVDYLNRLKEDLSIRYTNSILIETLIDRNISFFNYEKNQSLLNILHRYLDDNWKIVYLPFRLTDEGYKFKEILSKLVSLDNIKIVVLYSNPNNCDINSLAKNLKEKKYIEQHFINVGKNRDIYYTLIDYGNVIIPYFEDTYFINHAAIYEFETSELCKVVTNIEDMTNILEESKILESNND